MNKLNLVILLLITIICDNKILFGRFFANKTNYPIKFRIIGEGSKNNFSTIYTIDPNSTTIRSATDPNIPMSSEDIGVTNNMDYHIDVDLVTNNIFWGNPNTNTELAKHLSSAGPTEGWNTKGHKWYGAGSRTWWGVQFFNNPRGNFVITDGYLRLANNI